jgi:hypothetical protein
MQLIMVTPIPPTDTDRFVSDLKVYLQAFHKNAVLDSKRSKRLKKYCDNLLAVRPEYRFYRAELVFSRTISLNVKDKKTPFFLEKKLTTRDGWENFVTVANSIPEEFAQTIEESTHLRAKIYAAEDPAGKRAWNSRQLLSFSFDLTAKESK